jgi:transposase
MSKKRLSVRKTKEILRLKLTEKRSNRAVGKSVKCSASTVSDCIARFVMSGLSWPLPPEMDDEALEAKLYYSGPLFPTSRREVPDWGHVHTELRRKGVTLALLWEEYKQSHLEDGYQYSRFCDLYRRYSKTLDVTMRQTHKAGDKVFVDWSGDGIDIVDRETGEVTEAPLFVGVLGASGYTFATARENRESRQWIRCHMEMYEYFGGVPAATVPDNEKTGVTNPCLYEPDLNPTYAEFARHYDTAVLPTRPRKPRDKAKVENGVLNAQRWILAALRNHTFFSVDQANEAIAKKLEVYNARKYQRLDVSRRELFETLDRPVLRPLPSRRYEHGEWSKPKVNIDYHVEVDKHFYSVPYRLVGERTEARRTATTVEIFFKGKRAASHKRSYVKGGATTLSEHRPKSHREHLEWTPSRIISWAQKTGAHTAQVAEHIMASRQHPEQGYRSCLGVMRLGKKYGDKRLEAASQRALVIGSPSYKTIKSILEKGLDKQPLPPVQTELKTATLPDHENIRGPEYYH